MTSRIDDLLEHVTKLERELEAELDRRRSQLVVLFARRAAPRSPDLGPLGGLYSFASAVSDAGQVVGANSVPGDTGSQSYATLWNTRSNDPSELHRATRRVIRTKHQAGGACNRLTLQPSCLRSSEVDLARSASRIAPAARCTISSTSSGAGTTPVPTATLPRACRAPRTDGWPRG